jgi:hypothetical protein
VSRQVELFNGGLSGRELELKWQARWDSPDGEPIGEGRSGLLEVEPGFHTTCTLTWDLPGSVPRERALYWILESVRDEQVVFREDRIYFMILPSDATVPESAARFLGVDTRTQGDWHGKYGGVGHDVMRVVRQLPENFHVEWGGARIHTWTADTDEPRAMAGHNSRRVAACRYADEIELTVEGRSGGVRLSLYCVDWDRTRSKQQFTVWSDDGTILDQREVAGFQDGQYLTWEIRGRVHITIEHEGGLNAVVSGLFLD